jgi:hypothetical protein
VETVQLGAPTAQVASEETLNVARLARQRRVPPLRHSSPKPSSPQHALDAQRGTQPKLAFVVGQQDQAARDASNGRSARLCSRFSHPV